MERNTGNCFEKGEIGLKKNIGFVSLDFSLARWLAEKLRAAPPDAWSALDLREGLEGLMDGTAHSLMLELGDTEPLVPTDDTICCGSLSIFPKFRKVVRDGEEIPLTPKEFDILCFLARNRGEIFTKEQIYQAVWDNDYLLDDSNIMAFIRKLRKKIEPNPDAPEYILTIWGIGYKFNDTL